MDSFTSSDVLVGLWIAVAILCLIILYHVIFVVVDARKIVRRIELITKEVENAIIKPISMVDALVDQATKFISKQAAVEKKKKGKSKSTKK